MLWQLYTLAMPWLKLVLPYAGKYLFPTAIIAETGTVYLTVLVTVNRYLAVCRPYAAPGRRSVEAARLHVLAVAVFSIVYNLPRFFEFDVVTKVQVTSSWSAQVYAAWNWNGQQTGVVRQLCVKYYDKLLVSNH